MAILLVSTFVGPCLHSIHCILWAERVVATLPLTLANLIACCGLRTAAFSARPALLLCLPCCVRARPALLLCLHRCAHARPWLLPCIACTALPSVLRLSSRHSPRGSAAPARTCTRTCACGCPSARIPPPSEAPAVPGRGQRQYPARDRWGSRCALPP